ncbi:MAG: hypothetical protein KME10_19625 [Plectolyngbya sp. WJT66-NPBG17]|jgi:hypothetical protein|nr:hypothetical protein [Plectolyngbya sp. WJT66-NPBG17]
MTQAGIQPSRDQIAKVDNAVKDADAKFKDPKLRQKLTPDEIKLLHEYYRKEYGEKIFDFQTKKGCEKEIKKQKDWHTLVDNYARRYQWAMYCLILCRTEVVNIVLKECALALKSPLVAKSVGSTDLSSDYDVTIAAPDGNDVKILRAFNEAIKKEFQAQPGTLFDTNIYVKDYTKVEKNIEFSDVEDYKDSDLADGTKAMSDGDQDIAALVKQRRFSTSDEWKSYVTSVCQGFDLELQIKVRKQYDIADALFNLAVRDLLTALEDQFQKKKYFGLQMPLIDVDKDGQQIDDAKAANTLYRTLSDRLGTIAILYKRFESAKNGIKLKSLQKLWEPAQSPEQWQKVSKNLLVELATEAQANNSELLHLIQDYSDTTKSSELQKNPELFRDLVLKTSNRLYADVMERVRKAQKNPEVAKYETGRAIFFASEAYVSEGAVFDVVLGNQGSEEEKRKARAMIRPVHLLESFNEQYADFLKDIKHYAHGKALQDLKADEAGRLYYRSSKYLDRFFKAGEGLLEKTGGSTTMEKLAMKPLQLQSEKAVGEFKNAVGVLVQIRKGNYQFTEQEKGLSVEAKAFSLMTTQNIKNAQEFVDRITALAQTFNIEARKLIELKNNIYDDEKTTISFVKAYAELLGK